VILTKGQNACNWNHGGRRVRGNRAGKVFKAIMDRLIKNFGKNLHVQIQV
jgi:hypothetical protein